MFLEIKLIDFGKIDIKLFLKKLFESFIFENLIKLFKNIKENLNKLLNVIFWLIKIKNLLKVLNKVWFKLNLFFIIFK